MARIYYRFARTFGKLQVLETLNLTMVELEGIDGDTMDESEEEIEE